MPRRPLLAGLALAAVVVAAAGVVVLLVGFRDDPGPTKAAYVVQVSAICEEYGRKLDQIPPPGDLSSPGSVVESLQQAIPILEEEERLAKAVPRPKALQEDLARFYELTDKSIAELHNALSAALERALYPMATALTRFGEVRDEAKKVGATVGFTC